MTLTIDGQLVQVSSGVQAMIALLLDNQTALQRLPYGCVLLDYSPRNVGLRLLKWQEVLVRDKQTIDNVPLHAP